MTALLRDEGAALLPAAVNAVAAAAGVRILLVKGRAVEFHGLRPPRLSADVDVLVDPAGFDALCHRLRSLGWTGPEPTTVRYAAAFRHPLWPLELDLHRAFPGLTRREGPVFEALWDDRIELPIAGVSVPAVGWAGSVVIGVAHGLRSPDAPRNARELELIRQAVDAAGPARVDHLHRLVDVVGASVTVGAFLHGGSGVGLRGLTWLLALRGRPIATWPALVRTALLGQSELHVRHQFPDERAGRRGLWRARARRLRAAAREMVVALRAVVLQRRR